MLMLVTAPERVDVQGYVARGFERVRHTFAENFAQRRELGGAVALRQALYGALADL
jgi:hypothetical protein